MALFAAVLVTLGANGAQAQEQPQGVLLTEADVVASALGEPALETIASSIERRAAAEVAAARTWSNPEISYEREQLFGAEVEDTLVLQQVLRLSGRYRLLAESARVFGESRNLEFRARRLAHAAAVRTEFFGLLESQLRAAVYAELLDVMRGLDDELRRRVEAGESAPYERLRIQKEIADVEAAAGRQRASRQAHQVELARLLNVPGERATSLVAAGTLMPDDPPSDVNLTRAVLTRPDVAATDERMRAAELLERAAGRMWIPDPQLEVGYKTSAASGARDHGFVAGISVALPVFANAREHRLRAEAILLDAQGEKEFTTHHAIAKALGLAQKVRALRGVAEVYETKGIDTALQVVKTADLAYSAGELGILELIDGYRGLIEARLEVVDIAAEARASEIELWRELAITDSKVEP